MKRWLTAWLTLLMLVVASHVAAKPSEEQLKAARALANAGFELFSQGEWAQSYERFAAAERIYHAPPHLLYMARAKLKLGELVAARDLYQQLAEEQLPDGAPAEFAEAQEEARGEVEALTPKIPSVQIVVTGPPSEEVSVTVDDADVSEAARQGPVDVDAGERRIRASAKGWKPAETTVTLEPVAGVTDVELALEPEPTGAGGTTSPGADEAEGSLVPGLAVLGVGVAGLAVGLVTGLLAMDEADELEQACPQRNACPPENEQLEDDARTLGWVSTIGFIAGGVGVAVGTILLIIQPGGGSEPDEQEPEAVAVEPLLGPGLVGVRGTF